ncbi:unnamed protein product [Lampetra fluviatilis]
MSSFRSRVETEPKCSSSRGAPACCAAQTSRRHESGTRNGRGAERSTGMTFCSSGAPIGSSDREQARSGTCEWCHPQVPPPGSWIKWVGVERLNGARDTRPPRPVPTPGAATRPSERRGTITCSSHRPKAVSHPHGVLACPPGARWLRTASWFLRGSGAPTCSMDPRQPEVARRLSERLARRTLGVQILFGLDSSHRRAGSRYEYHLMGKPSVFLLDGLVPAGRRVKQGASSGTAGVPASAPPLHVGVVPPLSRRPQQKHEL